jgi:transposase-like protein
MKRRSEEEKMMWVEDWKGSGQSLSGYAKANGLIPQTFKKWVMEGEADQGFVEVRPAVEERQPYIPEILIEKGDIKIHIPLAINRNDLQTVVQSLGWQP